jgi:hypothetical protein
MAAIMLIALGQVDVLWLGVHGRGGAGVGHSEHFASGGSALTPCAPRAPKLPRVETLSKGFTRTRPRSPKPGCAVGGRTIDKITTRDAKSLIAKAERPRLLVLALFGSPMARAEAARKGQAPLGRQIRVCGRRNGTRAAGRSDRGRPAEVTEGLEIPRRREFQACYVVQSSACSSAATSRYSTGPCLQTTLLEPH